MPERKNIEVGDSVKHIKAPLLNGGLTMNVVETTEFDAKISYFDNTGVHKEDWVSKEDLEVAFKVQGGFRDAGEAP